ncbi:MAG: hypothetical protein IPL06_21230 [Betaproteobacteria bacterium]|nr:hypothetical protein [Betaproteobacteria bacterium]
MMKPVAAGAIEVAGGIAVNEDAGAHLALSALRFPRHARQRVRTLLAGPPIAPHIAAQGESIAVDMECYHRLS